jgi:signal peptidase I
VRYPGQVPRILIFPLLFFSIVFFAGGAVFGVLRATGQVLEYRVPTASMEPTLHCPKPTAGCLGTRATIVVVWAGRTVSRGGIVVFHASAQAKERCQAENGEFVKRVIALPGELFAEREGVVFVNGHALNEPYVRASRRGDHSTPPFRVPAGRIVVLGDNRAVSCDSRVYGPVQVSSVAGTVVQIF